MFELTAFCIYLRYQSSDPNSHLEYGPDSIKPPLDPTEVRRLCAEYKESMKLNLDEIRQIEVDTRDQGNDTSGLWIQLWRPRLTSSNFGIVCKRRSTTPVTSLVKNLLYRPASSYASSLRWDRENKDNARKAYAEEMTKRGTSVVITKTDLVISDKHYLACSPDDFVKDESVNDTIGVAEYKCPYSARETTPTEACTTIKNFSSTLKDGKVELKRNHNYYYQIQGVMGITKRQWCDFVIWTPKGISVERIPFDPILWSPSWTSSGMMLFCLSLQHLSTPTSMLSKSLDHGELDTTVHLEDTLATQHFS